MIIPIAMISFNEIVLFKINIKIKIVSKGARPLANGYATEKSSIAYALVKECMYMVWAMTPKNKYIAAVEECRPT